MGTNFLMHSEPTQRCRLVVSFSISNLYRILGCSQSSQRPTAAPRSSNVRVNRHSTLARTKSADREAAKRLARPLTIQSVIDDENAVNLRLPPLLTGSTGLVCHCCWRIEQRG